MKTEFDLSYSMLLKRVMAQKPQKDKRTGLMVRSIDGAFFKDRRVPILNLRDIKPLWTCAEAVWFMAGDCEVDFMNMFGFKNWDMFADDKGRVQSATGYRWRRRHGPDQLTCIIDKLYKDKTARRGVLLSWNPVDDLINDSPNAPCVVAWHLHVIDDKLHMSAFQRSCDLYFGFPHDILGSRLIQEMVAPLIGVGVGNISYFISNGHLYEDQWQAAEEMMAREASERDISYGPDSLELKPNIGMAAMNGDPEVVEYLMKRLLKFYDPWPAIKGPRLVK